MAASPILFLPPSSPGANVSEKLAAWAETYNVPSDVPDLGLQFPVVSHGMLLGNAGGWNVYAWPLEGRSSKFFNPRTLRGRLEHLLPPGTHMIEFNERSHRARAKRSKEWDVGQPSSASLPWAPEMNDINFKKVADTVCGAASRVSDMRPDEVEEWGHCVDWARSMASSLSSRSNKVFLYRQWGYDFPYLLRALLMASTADNFGKLKDTIMHAIRLSAPSTIAETLVRQILNKDRWT
eukprot:8815909-Pyramimonas_sp.AAC.1